MLKRILLTRFESQSLLKDFEPEAIIHLAAETHVDRSIESAHAFIQTNVVGTSVLLDSARKYWSDLPSDRQRRFRFVMVSTDEVYGSLNSVMILLSTREVLIFQAHRMPQAKRRPIILLVLGTELMVCRSSSATAPTILVLTNSLRN